MDKQKGAINISYCLVAFIDLLGQRQALKSLSRLPDPNNEKEYRLIVEKVRDTYGTVLFFHESFSQYMESFMSSEHIPIPLSLRVHLASRNIKTQTFSDGLVLYASLEESADHLPINDVYGILTACASMFVLFLSVGKPFRGGIEVAIGMETNEHGIYGPAVADAYTLESEIAKHPRIAVGPNLIRYLESEQRVPQKTIREQFRVQMAELCQSILTIDEDGQLVVDVLGEGLRECISAEALGELPIRAHQFVEDQIVKWEVEGNEKLLRRYHRLKDYLDSRMDLWIRK